MLSIFGLPVVHPLLPGNAWSTSNYEKLLTQLIRLEGRWLAPYYDGSQFLGSRSGGDEISDWAKQEGRRASVLAEMMRTGRDEPRSVSERRSDHKPMR
jgi:hypothetical protein